MTWLLYTIVSNSDSFGCRWLYRNLLVRGGPVCCVKLPLYEGDKWTVPWKHVLYSHCRVSDSEFILVQHVPLSSTCLDLYFCNNEEIPWTTEGIRKAIHLINYSLIIKTCTLSNVWKQLFIYAQVGKKIKTVFSLLKNLLLCIDYIFVLSLYTLYEVLLPGINQYLGICWLLCFLNI